MKRRLGIVVATGFVGCNWGGDPELKQTRRAVEAWEVGTAHLEAGDPEEALEAFEKARELRPNDVYLLAWSAKAAAAAGNLEAAIDLLGEALMIDPEFAEARYNRGAYRARLGQLELAATDLRLSLVAGVIEPREVLEDEDFKPHLGHPSFAFLPARSLDGSLTVPEALTFVGSEFTVVLRIKGQGAIEVEAPAVSLAGQIVRVTETRTPADVKLAWTFRATGNGEATLGPFDVTRDGTTSRVDGGLVRMGAPPDRATESFDLTAGWARSPSQIVHTRTSPDAWTEDGVLFVLAEGSDRVEVEEGEPLVWYRFEDFASQGWVLRAYAAKDQATVSVHRRGVPILQTEVGG